MTTNHVAAIAAAQARLAAAQAEVEDIRARLDAERAAGAAAADGGGTHRLSAADGRAEAQRRIAERRGAAAGTDESAGSAEGDALVAPQADKGRAAGLAEARRRGYAR